MNEIIETTGLARRGRQRTPKPWLMAVMCGVGLHDGSWEYTAAGDCVQGRECRRCGTVHIRSKHQREWRYVRDGACHQVRNCERCSDTDGGRTTHEWSETWEPETRWWQSSKEAHRCLRCREEEEWTVNDGD